MAVNVFNPAIAGDTANAVEFITNILQSSTEYSIIGKGLDGTILLWNEGARRMYGYEPQKDEVIAFLHQIESCRVQLEETSRKMVRNRFSPERMVAKL